MRDVAVVGGGCYGTFYAGQLARAKERGKARFRRVVVVDRDPACRARVELGETPDRVFVAREWVDYFRELLGGATPAAADEPRDYIVPSPLMPHLMFQWLLARARERWPGRAIDVGPVPGEPGTPYDRTGPDRTRYVSFADWICPTHCIEPAICPAIGSARTWEMGDAVRGLTERLRAAGEPVHGPALFVCRHHVFGVGSFAVDAVHAGEYWAAHEALETVWRSIISDGDAAAARVWQGLIQAAAALLHQQRGNSHGVATVGRGALEKLAGRQRPDVEVETVRFRAQLERALAGDAEAPRLELRAADGELRSDEGNR